MFHSVPGYCSVPKYEDVTLRCIVFSARENDNNLYGDRLDRMGRVVSLNATSFDNPRYVVSLNANVDRIPESDRSVVARERALSLARYDFQETEENLAGQCGA